MKQSVQRAYNISYSVLVLVVLFYGVYLLATYNLIFQQSVTDGNPWPWFALALSLYGIQEGYLDKVFQWRKKE